MDTTPENLGDRLARITRIVLIAGIVIVATLLITNPRPALNPFSVGPAHAEVSASPGYLALTTALGGANKFYVIDSNKQVICVYDSVGDKLRLVSARKFDVDGDIFDGSLQVGRFRGIEGGNGVTRVEAKEYSDALKKMWEEATKKTK